METVLLSSAPQTLHSSVKEEREEEHLVESFFFSESVFYVVLYPKVMDGFMHLSWVSKGEMVQEDLCRQHSGLKNKTWTLQQRVNML